MKRRIFLKTIALSLVATTAIFNSKNLLSSTNFDSNGKQIIEFYCYGGADFRFLFAPFDEGEYKELYFDKQSDIILPEDYQNIKIDNKDYLIRKDANQLIDMFQNNEIAIIPNTWFSPNRDHNYSSKKALISIEEDITPINEVQSSWIGKISGYTNKNTISLTSYFSYATKIDDNFPDSKSITAINTRPFGIQNSNNFVDKALERFYLKSESQNLQAKHFLNQQRNISSLSKKVNSFLETKTPVEPTTTSSFLNNQIVSLFDTIDTNKIFNSSNYFLNYGSFDLHNELLSYNYKYTNVFGDKQGLYTIVQELKKRNLWNDTVIVINSEFGRQIKQNGRKGKDHGHGNLLFVAGGAVNGGIYGDMFPPSEIDKFKSSVGYDIEGKTNGIAIYAKIADFISQGLGETIYENIQDVQIEQEFELFKSNT